ncbi:MAG: hypothetical protein WBA13_19200 [Microcoleaceae cyanobacterium]
MSLTKRLITLFAIALVFLFLGFNSLFTQDVFANSISNPKEKQEFKQLIDQINAA